MDFSTQYGVHREIKEQTTSSRFDLECKFLRSNLSPLFDSQRTRRSQKKTPCADENPPP